MRRLSLRWRLLLLTAGLLLTGLALTSAAVAQHMERYQLDRIDDQLRALTSILRTVPAAQSLPLDTGAQPSVLDATLDLVGAPYLISIDADGAVTGGLRSSDLHRGDLPSLDQLTGLPTDGTAVTVRSADGHTRWRVAAATAPGREGTVVAATRLDEADATVDRLRIASLASGTVLLGLLTATGWFAVGRGLRPLRRIEQTAASIAGGDLTHRVPDIAPPGTEIGNLADSLNAMLGQLENAFDDRMASESRMRTFLSDVSHELRTPLAGIKGSAQLYLMGALTQRSDIETAMRQIDREATRLTALTEDLLLLARLDEAPDEQLDRTPMDLRTLAGDARQELRALDPSRPVEITGPDGNGAPEPAPVIADENRLRQVVVNLIGNAVAHTPPGSPVRIGVGTIANRAVLDVIDEGPGMTTQHAARVFDRFYQTDRSRNRSGATNAGLGLAIARALARAHEGDIDLRTELGKGARFRLVLPLPPPDSLENDG